MSAEILVVDQLQAIHPADVETRAERVTERSGTQNDPPDLLARKIAQRLSGRNYIDNKGQSW